MHLAITAPLVLGAGILLYMVNLREAHFSHVPAARRGMDLHRGRSSAMNLFRKSRKAPWRYVFVLVSAYLALRYIWWRSFETLIYTHPVDFVGMTALYLAELYSLTLQLMSLFVNLSPLASGARAAARGPVALAHGGHLHPHLQRGRGDRAPDGARRHPDRLSQGPLPRPHPGRRRRRSPSATTPRVARRRGGGATSSRRSRASLGVNYLTRETNRAREGRQPQPRAHPLERRADPLPRLRPRADRRHPAGHGRATSCRIRGSSSCRRRISSPMPRRPSAASAAARRCRTRARCSTA